MLRNPAMRGRFSFRMGTTSYIIPADMVQNVEFLAPLVEDIELLFLESHETSELPGKDTISGLGALAAAGDLSYTVHLPMDVRLGSPDAGERRRSVEKCLRVMELTGALSPRAWIVHFQKENTGEHRSWTEALEASTRELLASGIPPQRLCVETLDYPFEQVEDVVAGNGLSVCLDVGHILQNGFPLEDYLDHYIGSCAVMHLHSIIGGKDHCSIAHLGDEVLSMLFGRAGPRMARDDGQRVVTIEVFNRPDLESSLRAAERLAL